MKKIPILILIFAGAFLYSCNHQGKKETGQKPTNSRSITSDSTLFSLKGKGFTATLTTADYSISGVLEDNNGPLLKRRKTSSLVTILSLLYKGKIKLINEPYEGSHYSLKVKWQVQTPFDKVKHKIAGKMKEIFGYSIKTEMRKEPRYILSVKNYSTLEKHRSIHRKNHISRGTVLSQVKVLNNSWEVFGTLKGLVKVLEKRTSKEIVLKNNYGSKFYLFKLRTNKGFVDVVNQLEEDYGLTFRKKMVLVEHHTIKF